MGSYAVVGRATNTASQTIGSLNQPASALKRLKVFYMSLGSSATADNAYELIVQRTTTTGTNTSITPQLLDPADGAASAVAGRAHSGEPTYTSNAVLLNLAGHQRGVQQWYAPPGSELVVAVTNNAGLGLFTNAVTSAFTQDFCIHYME